MLEDEFSRENVLAVSFSEHSNAYEALSRLKELDAKGEVGVRGAAVVVREEDGKIATKEEIEDSTWEGAASGGLVGLLVGVIGGPLGILNLGGTVLRRSGPDVRAEIAAAEEAQREAKEKARNELREARKKKQKDEIDAKLDALKTKLGRHKEPTASS